MKTWKRRIIGAAVITLVAAACGDDDSTDTTGTAPAGTAASSTTTTTGAGDAETTTSTSGTTLTTQVDPTVAGGDADTAEILALLDAFAVSDVRTTYRVGATGEEFELILSQRPTAEPPVSATIIEAQDTRIITFEDRTIFCSAGTGCIELATGGGEDAPGLDVVRGAFGPLLASVVTADDVQSNPGIEFTTDFDEIAGRRGLCFSFDVPPDPTADVQSIRQCIDAELGFVLLMETTNLAGVEQRVMELLEFGEPRDEDFEPTGPVTTLPQP